MSQQTGDSLLHYTLVEKIGEGGMGVVWRAVDTTLDREVAIKLLPDTLAESSERLARFEREAKLLASLNHRGLASVYGVHRSGSTHFIAMELVPGEDLSLVLNRGPLSVSETADLAHQLAEGLEAAHDRGVIHRDLKPANIKLCEDGGIKILDFGLAKSLESPSESGGDLTSSPTMTSTGTIAGTVLGTAGYMSPEQSRGQEVDQRSDIWSFGCVVWECLTGAALFGRETVSDSIGAILHSEPNWEELPAEVPEKLRRVLRRCLVKDPRGRLHHIADARIDLEQPEPPASPAERPRRRSTATLIVSTLAVAISTAAIFLQFFKPPAIEESVPDETNPLAEARFSRVTNFPGSEFDAAISPDGRFVTFVSDRDGPFDVFVTQIGTGRFRNLSSDVDGFQFEDARAPVRSVGFNGDGTEIWIGGGPWRRVRSMPLLGGSLRNFLGEHVVTVSWSPDGELVVYHERLAGDPLYVADRDGSNSRLILVPSAGTHQHYPVFSTNGEWIFVVRGRPATLEMDLWRVGVDGEGLEQLTFGKLDVRYPTPIDARTVLYSALDSDGAGPWLWALDVETGVSRRASVGLERYGSLSASADGRRLVASIQDHRARLWRVPILDRTATENDVRPFADLSSSRALAPRFGGSTLFYLSSLGSGDGLWRFVDGRAQEIWRGSDTALLEPPAVSPDGRSVVMLLRREEGWHLHVLSADGAQLRVLSEIVDARGSAAWSPDGQWVVTGGFVDGVEGLYKIPVNGDPPVRIADGEALNPVWSPDGALIVYTGAQVNVVLPLVAIRPDGAPVELPDIEVFRLGQRARFLPDGSGLVYMRGAWPLQNFWLLDLDTMQSRRLTQLDSVATMRTFDISPDGTHIVFDRLTEHSDLVLIELGD